MNLTITTNNSLLILTYSDGRIMSILISNIHNLVLEGDSVLIYLGNTYLRRTSNIDNPVFINYNNITDQPYNNAQELLSDLMSKIVTAISSMGGGSDLSQQFTLPVSIVANQNITDSYTNIGNVIDMTGYTHLLVIYQASTFESTNVDLKPFLITNSTESELVNSGIVQVARLWGSDDSILNSVINRVLEIEIGAIPSLQLKVIAETVGATPAVLSVSIAKIWRG